MLDVRGLLTRDAICRKLREWPLLSADEMQYVLTKTTMLRKQGSEEFFELQRRFPTAHRRWTVSMTDIWPGVEMSADVHLDDKFPFSADLLDHFSGKMVVAGGAVFKALYGLHADDIDFFFVDPEVETLDPHTAQTRYDNLLAEAISFLTDRWLHEPHPESSVRHEEPGGINNVYVSRSEFVTTVHLISTRFASIKYQFIHRVYPNIGSILGGFDLGPCMVAYDGRNVLATELGAWSALSATLIVDTSRRSTSFEHRIRKYSNLCHVVLPGLSPELIRSLKPGRQPGFNVLEKLEDIVFHSGYHAKCKGFIMLLSVGDRTDHILGNSKFEPVEEQEDAKDVAKKLRKKAFKHGYELEDPIQLKPKAPAFPGSVQDFENMLQNRAQELGHHLELNLFASLVFSKQCDYQTKQKVSDRLQYEHILRPKRTVLKLPCAHLNVEAFSTHFRYQAERKEQMWTISCAKRDRVAVKSDYGDNQIWPLMSTGSNLTMLIGNNLSAVTCTLILKAPNAIAVTPHGEEDDGFHGERTMRNLGQLATCVTDAPKGEAKRILLESFEWPKFGDIGEEFSELFSHRGQQITDMVCGTHGEQLSSSFVWKEISKRLEKVHTKLIGVKWIVRNPGRQWTSSINPIMSDPRAWYGEHYQSFKIGCEEIETWLRLFRLRDNRWKLLPKDIFDLIVRLVVWGNSFIM